MDYSKYPVPVWTKASSWKQNIKKNPWKIEAIIRDSYKCVDCGRGDVRLIVHHIDESRSKKVMNNDLTNLVTLCQSCHAKRHGMITSDEVVNAIKLLADLNNGMLKRGDLTKIGKKFELSRERIRQIAKKMGYVMPNKTAELERFCKCLNCGNIFYSKLKRSCCSKKCYKEHRLKKYWKTKKCEYCKKLIKYRRALDNIGLTPVFCSKKCQGSHAARNYGFKANPQNAIAQNVSKSPEVKEVLKNDFGHSFTVKQFKNKYGYKTHIGAYSRLQSLVEKNIVEIIYKGRPNLYKVIA